MEIKLYRLYNNADYCIGKVYVGGNYFCDCIEDTVRELNSEQDKIYGKTAIPSGKYKVVVNQSPKFRKIMPLLLDVPFFTGIRIHNGRTEEHSEGCLIFGRNTKKGEVTNSLYFCDLITQLLIDEENEGFPNYIEIINKF